MIILHASCYKFALGNTSFPLQWSLHLKFLATCSFPPIWSPSKRVSTYGAKLTLVPTLFMASAYDSDGFPLSSRESLHYFCCTGRNATCAWEDWWKEPALFDIWNELLVLEFFKLSWSFSGSGNVFGVLAGRIIFFTSKRHRGKRCLQRHFGLLSKWASSLVVELLPKLSLCNGWLRGSILTSSHTLSIISAKVFLISLWWKSVNPASGQSNAWAIVKLWRPVQVLDSFRAWFRISNVICLDFQTFLR